MNHCSSLIPGTCAAGQTQATETVGVSHPVMPLTLRQTEQVTTLLQTTACVFTHDLQGRAQTDITVLDPTKIECLFGGLVQ